ncbi:MAG: branched-chain amino acid ABC transporter permease [Desulfobacteraceae bacterium]|uniref:Branched-chain amino acid ABC transporter permease n=1 Tax=Candidatus Desulfacyla euxinica TaxID=2841693 RepID=A0A8J6N0F0_9DELT|nr:branched-chain amino acid ABC transporter permease [Candidatus Desulfacyla euxinica]MBL6978808.1 branched-chain amino acid ABC transporter permease [Desulfobacteraceae bacterium]
MRFLMKRNYNQDIQLFKYRSTFFWYLALIIGCCLLPLVLDDYITSQLSFICMYSIATVGLMLLTGYTGQISMGHAAFFGIGAYTSAILTSKGVPFLLALPTAGLLAGFIGIFIGLPALRLSGLYLAIATMGFGFIVDEVLVRWESLTNGNMGMMVDPVSIGPLTFETEVQFYYLTLVVLVLTILAAKNILRSPTGRAMIAIRDSEVAAQAMGISMAKYKTMAFAISAFFTGVAGSLYGHKLTFINPESFTILVSIEFLAMIIIGGLGSLHGAVYGAAFIIFLPQLIIMTKDYMPKYLADQTGLESALYGLMIMLFILFEPMGIYGIWRKKKFYFEMFPLYKKDTFKKEKKYFKAERH